MLSFSHSHRCSFGKLHGFETDWFVNNISDNDRHGFHELAVTFFEIPWSFATGPILSNTWLVCASCKCLFPQVSPRFIQKSGLTFKYQFHYFHALTHICIPKPDQCCMKSNRVVILNSYLVCVVHTSDSADINRVTNFSSSSTNWSRLQHKCTSSCRDECCENSLYSLLTRIIWPTSLSLLIFTPVNRQPRAKAAGFPVHTNTPSGLLLMLLKTLSALICKVHHLSFKKNRGKARRTYAPLLSLQCELSLVATAKLKHPKTTLLMQTV